MFEFIFWSKNLKTPSRLLEDKNGLLRCEYAPIAVYTACGLLTLCPVMAICCFPLAEKTVFLSFTNFILSFAMALASGSLFFLLFPSCLEDRSKFTAENERLSRGFYTEESTLYTVQIHY